MEKVAYAIVSGDYSDYSVSFIVDGTREEAEALAERMSAAERYDHYVVEEFGVVSPDLPMITLSQVVLNFRHGPDSESSFQSVDWGVSPWPEVQVQWRNPELRVFGTDDDRVWKAFWDRKAQILAHVAETGELPPREA